MPYKVAVLMGGSSFERDFSLASGKHVIRTLEATGHTCLPLDTTESLTDVLRQEQPDVAYIALHGKNGEDGTIQSLLEFLGIPYVGSKPGSCRFAWNKKLLPFVVQSFRAGSDKSFSTTGPASWPERIYLAAVAFKDMGAAAALDLVPQRIKSGFPVAVLPARGGSAMGISKVSTPDGLAPALLDALSFDDEVLIEEWVEGVELAVSVVGTGADAYALPPVEIRPKTSFFDVDARADSDLVDYYAPVRPAALTSPDLGANQIVGLIQAAALEVHRAHRCRDISRVDLIWDGEKARVLEINISPGMTEYSLFPLACRAAGQDFGELLESLLQEAISRKDDVVSLW